MECYSHYFCAVIEKLRIFSITHLLLLLLDDHCNTELKPKIDINHIHSVRIMVNTQLNDCDMTWAWLLYLPIWQRKAHSIRDFKKTETLHHNEISCLWMHKNNISISTWIVVFVTAWQVLLCDVIFIDNPIVRWRISYQKPYSLFLFSPK